MIFLLLWIVLAALAIVPGALIARLLSLFRLHPYVILLVLLGVPIAASYAIGNALFPTDESHRIFENLMILTPPLVIGMFVGYLMGEKRQPHS